MGTGSFLRRWTAAGTVVLLLLLFGSVASAQTGDPPGNNGTVKIHEGDGEAEPLVRNEPHVCNFHVHWFSFDDLESIDWEIRAWPPTGDGQTVVASGSTVLEGGEGRTAVMSLPDGHYKLYSDSVAAPGGEKHKVFWVECEVAAATSSTSSTSTTTSSSTTTTSTTIAGAATSSTTSTTAAAEVLGEQLTTSTAAAAPIVEVKAAGAQVQAAAQETLPFTGEWLRSLGGMAFALLALGALIVATVRNARLYRQ